MLATFLVNTRKIGLGATVQHETFFSSDSLTLIFLKVMSWYFDAPPLVHCYMIFLHDQKDLWEQAAHVSHGLNISVTGRKLFLLVLSLWKALWTQWDPACAGKGELNGFRELGVNSFQCGGTHTWWMWAVQALMAQDHDCHGASSSVAIPSANGQGRQAKGQLRFLLEISWSAGVPSLFFLNECTYP